MDVYVNSTEYSKIGLVKDRILGTISQSRYIAVNYAYDEPTRRLNSMNVLPYGRAETIDYQYDYDDSAAQRLTGTSGPSTTSATGSDPTVRLRCLRRHFEGRCCSARLLAMGEIG